MSRFSVFACSCILFVLSTVADTSVPAAPCVEGLCNAPVSEGVFVQSKTYVQQAPDLARIELEGVRHASYRSLRYETLQGGHSMDRFGRPEWQKSLRCFNESQFSCSECWDRDNCWGGHLRARHHGFNNDFKRMRYIRAVRREDGSLGWERFLNIIHIKCDANRFSMSRKVYSLTGGELRVFWDEQELTTDYQGISSSRGPSMSPFTVSECRGNSASGFCGEESLLAIELQMGFVHELMVEFRIDPLIATKTSVTPSAQLELHLVVTSSYQICEDTQSCLSILPQDSEDARHLRNSNSLQFQCLETSSPQQLHLIPYCPEWRQCLQNSGQEARVLELLQALGVSKLSVPSNNDLHCFNPLTEDPESLNCDCYDKMLRRCQEVQEAMQNYDETLCLRAQMCGDPHVCEGWKRAACGGLEHYEVALNSNADMMQYRALTTSRDHSYMDDTMGNFKMC